MFAHLRKKVRQQGKNCCLTFDGILVAMPHLLRICIALFKIMESISQQIFIDILFGRAESPNVAHSPGQRPGGTYAAINTFGIFALAQKCHAPQARNPLTLNGALPLIRLVALSERDTLVNAMPPTPGVARGYGQQLGFQPATIIARHYV